MRKSVECIIFTVNINNGKKISTNVGKVKHYSAILKGGECLLLYGDGYETIITKH